MRPDRLVAALFLAAPPLLAASPAAGTTSVALDGNRMYAELGFVRPDGSIHRGLAFVDMGSAVMVVKERLFSELWLDHDRSLRFQVGTLLVDVPRAEIESEPGEPRSIGSLRVEATLPARILARYEVVLDPGGRTLTLARPGTLRPTGVPVPFRIKPETGLIAVDASIGGKRHPVTIDIGSAYTWFRQLAAKEWLRAHPEWERGIGAVGAANMRMADDGAETEGILLRIPEVVLGPLALRQVGALGAGRGRGPDPNVGLFDWYAGKNAAPVIGWIGGNVLKAFRLTLDYPNRMSYWMRQTDPETDDLHQVGLTLRFEAGDYFVAGIARRNGVATVEGVLPGDRLVRVDGLDTRGATRGAVFHALHGNPGDLRRLVLERPSRRLTVAAPVTAF